MQTSQCPRKRFTTRPAPLRWEPQTSAKCANLAQKTTIHGHPSHPMGIQAQYVYVYIYILFILCCVYIYILCYRYIYICIVHLKWSDDHLLHWKINHVLTGSVRTQPLSHTPCIGGGGMRLKPAKILHTAVNQTKLRNQILN